MIRPSELLSEISRNGVDVRTNPRFAAAICGLGGHRLELETTRLGDLPARTFICRCGLASGCEVPQ